MTKPSVPTTPDDRAGDAGRPSPGRLRKHSLIIAGHQTSVSLEDAFWTALERMARRRGESVTRLVTAIDAGRTGNLSSAIRVHILTELEDRLRTGQDRIEGSGQGR